ncbi:MAG: leucine--tRNA ligase [Candidatus Taylorbacteria bacterium]|nr:leucine--tRNA ligase [Candidatus Taylorbacteria bacterium]
MIEYNHKDIEAKWQKKWKTNNLYKTSESKDNPKCYVLDMFPYPSGEGLHVGHPKGYIATDVYSRFKRMNGFNVLHPMGWDAFGLPAENYAIKNKVHPRVAVEKNIARFKEQLEIIGLDYDWERELNTTDPKYYKWTQWIFLKLLEKGLAYESFEPINWCPSCQTGLANEDLDGDKCERCGTLVEKKPMRQWVLRITDYAERLLSDLDAIVPFPFTTTSGSDAWREDMPVSEGDAVYCIIKHWSEDKFLCMKWKKNDWKGYVIGGIEKGETPEEAAIREVREETGYQNVISKGVIGRTDSRFYQELKKQNRLAHGRVVSLELTDGKRSEISDEEKMIQDMEWVPRDQVRDFVNRGDLKYMWDLYTGNVKSEPALNWPESIKTSQKNWIGKSQGVNFKCRIKDLGIEVQMYNSVPQTYRAETFTVIAPEHKLVSELVKGTEYEKEVLDFVEKIKIKKAGDKFDVDNDMEGIFTGRYIEDYGTTGKDLPIWIASYVVADYGTGIVNASAHDTRDFAFAKKYNIELHPVMFPKDPKEAQKVKNTDYAYVKDPHGILSEPEEFKGREWGEAREDIINYLVTNGFAERKINYKLRDWVFSRQRYWGEPIPVIHCEKCGAVPVLEKDLPVILPEVESYAPTGTGESPLADIPEWVNTKCPKCAGNGKRETNTMPQWAGSSWYYLRYIDTHNEKSLVDKNKEKYWSPVDLYVGGAEHATRHLIYARFWHKFLYDIGVVNYEEPFRRLQHVGLINAEDGRKMSKRYGNVINPDDMIDTYGADTLRMYEMFMGPFDQSIAWSSKNMIGPRRFIEKIWRFADKVTSDAHTSTSVVKALNKTIKKVTEDIEAFKFNTAISEIMILSNLLEKEETISKSDYEVVLQLIAPFAPHFTEEIWMHLGHKNSIHCESWPRYDQTKISDGLVTVVVQVNGKMRCLMETEKGTEEADIVKKALQNKDIARAMNDKEIKKTVYVKDRLVNFVI